MEAEHDVVGVWASVVLFSSSTRAPPLPTPCTRRTCVGPVVSKGVDGNAFPSEEAVRGRRAGRPRRLCRAFDATCGGRQAHRAMPCSHSGRAPQSASSAAAGRSAARAAEMWRGAESPSAALKTTSNRLAASTRSSSCQGLWAGFLNPSARRMATLCGHAVVHTACCCYFVIKNCGTQEVGVRGDLERR